MTVAHSHYYHASLGHRILGAYYLPCPMTGIIKTEITRSIENILNLRMAVTVEKVLLHLHRDLTVDTDTISHNSSRLLVDCKHVMLDDCHGNKNYCLMSQIVNMFCRRISLS